MMWSIKSISSFLSNSGGSFNQLAKGSNRVAAGGVSPTLMQALAFLCSKPDGVNNVSPDPASVAGAPKQGQDRRKFTKIRIALKSFDQRNYWGLPHHDSSVRLPTRRTLYTVLRSPFVHKKSREQFHKLVRKQLLTINTNRHELAKKYFWLKRQRIFGAQYEVQMFYKTRLDKETLQELLSR